MLNLSFCQPIVPELLFLGHGTSNCHLRFILRVNLAIFNKFLYVVTCITFWLPRTIQKIFVRLSICVRFLLSLLRLTEFATSTHLFNSFSKLLSNLFLYHFFSHGFSLHSPKKFILNRSIYCQTLRCIFKKLFHNTSVLFTPLLIFLWTSAYWRHLN